MGLFNKKGEKTRFFSPLLQNISVLQYYFSNIDYS